MKVVEVLKLSRSIIDTLQKSCIKMDDIRYLPMYDEYQRMVKAGCKKSSAIATLVDVFHISERQVYYVVKKFSQDCKVDAE